LDGSIEVKLRASGYIFGAFHAEPRSSSALASRSSSSNEYGYRIHPGVQTSIHDHVVNFRADFDICGPKNTLVHTSLEPLQRQYSWDEPEVSGPRNTMHLLHQPVTHETGLNWPKNSAGMYLITAPNSTNKWGETRAYRILPGTGMGNPSHLTILNSTTLGNSASWSSSDLWVLKNHPATEPGSAHHYNYLDPAEPLVDFNKMVEDREAIEDEDLVVYFNLGGHHVPSSQDIPNTLMHTSASSVLFMPFNYFDDDVSKQWRQGVRIDRAPSQQKASKSPADPALKEEVRSTPSSSSRRAQRRSDSNPSIDDSIAAAAASSKRIATKNKADDGVTWFGGHYTSSSGVHVSQEALTPDLSHYMKERDEGEEGGWKAVRNDVGGGLLGLFVGKQRGGGGGSRKDEDRKGPGMDW
jgi:hypothetical protein